MFTLALRKFEPLLGLFALQCHMRNVSNKALSKKYDKPLTYLFYFFFPPKKMHNLNHQTALLQIAQFSPQPKFAKKLFLLSFELQNRY